MPRVSEVYSRPASVSSREIRAMESALRAALETVEYSEYLRTDHWARIRQRTLRYWENRCAICYSQDNLQIHHRTYSRRGHEQDNDVVALCSYCHRLFHEHGRLAEDFRS